MTVHGFPYDLRAPANEVRGVLMPSARFFDLARGLGLNVSDTDHLGIEQINKVHD
jgi:hypothetical protein